MCLESSVSLIFCGTEVFPRVKKKDGCSIRLFTDQDRILYRGEAFTLTGNTGRKDAAHGAEVQPDGQVKTMKNGRYSEWRVLQ